MRFVNTKTLILLGTIAILLLLIKNIITSIVTLQTNSHIVTELKKQEKEEISRRDFLKQQLYFSNKPEFIETEARDKLGMVKQGEYVVIVPSFKKEEKKEILTIKTPNWKKWWNLFF